MKLSHFHTPELTPSQMTHPVHPGQNSPSCAIAIDVLRATTTIATALHVGAEAVQIFSDMTKLMAVSEAWPAEKRLRAGERGGHRVEGCDLGNSPLDCTPERFGDRRLFISTTNGTRALQTIQAAPAVLTAALVNRSSVVDYLVENQPETVWIVSAGWEGSFALEDTVCAGAIVHLLQKRLGVPLLELVGNDEMTAAVALYEQWADRLIELFHYASHGQRLLRLQCEEDLRFCATLDSLDILPIQTEPGVLKRHV